VRFHELSGSRIHPEALEYYPLQISVRRFGGRHVVVGRPRDAGQVTLAEADDVGVPHKGIVLIFSQVFVEWMPVQTIKL